MAIAYELNGEWVKECPHCKETKSVDGFALNRASGDGRDYWCRECRKVPPKHKCRKYEKDSQWLKECARCHEHKEVAEFGAAKKTFDKLTSICKPCQTILTAEYRRRKMGAVGVAAVRATQTASKRRFREENPEYVESQRVLSREWIKANRPHVNAKMRKRRAEDPAFRLMTNVRNKIIDVLTGRKKESSTLGLIGCTWDELKRHIERLWTEGMSWDNYGGGRDDWSLDHVLPCELFDHTQLSHQKVCFHYTNVRPLWHLDNMAKGDLLLDGTRARHLTPEERKAYLVSHGFAHLF